MNYKFLGSFNVRIIYCYMLLFSLTSQDISRESIRVPWQPKFDFLLQVTFLCIFFVSWIDTWKVADAGKLNVFLRNRLAFYEIKNAPVSFRTVFQENLFKRI
jgi:hypothetical protein